MAIFPMDDERYAATYAAEAAMVDASELIARALEKSGMSQAGLARALGVSRSEITARLRGERNITVRKLAQTLHAMGQQLDLGCRPAAAEPTPQPKNYLEWRSPFAESRADRAISSGQGWVKQLAAR